MSERADTGAGPDQDQVQTCPNCDRTNLYERSPNGRPASIAPDKDWFCRDCRHVFDDPVERPPHPPGRSPDLDLDLGYEGDALNDHGLSGTSDSPSPGGGDD